MGGAAEEKCTAGPRAAVCICTHRHARVCAIAGMEVSFAEIERSLHMLMHRRLFDRVSTPAGGRCGGGDGGGGWVGGREGQGSLTQNSLPPGRASRWFLFLAD